MDNSRPQDLEDRLRGMILGNAGAPAQSFPPAQTPTRDFPHSQQFVTLPPNTQQPENMQPTNGGANGGTHGGKKKLNQAQRRQMSSQLSIPIDPRPQAQGMVRGNGNRASQGQQRVPQNMNFQGHQGHQGQQYQNGRASSNHSSNPNNLSPAFPVGSPLSPYDHHMQIHQQVRSPIQPVYSYSPSQMSPMGDPRLRHGSGQHQGAQFGPRAQPQHRQLYQPGNASGGRGSINAFSAREIQAQSDFVQGLVDDHVDKIAIERSEILEKESFRRIIEDACRQAITSHEMSLGNTNFNPATVQLKCFGSMASGFATKASDMDLALLTPFSNPHPESPESQIPRILEKTLLELGFGTRLLTKTRVPIIKICERPTKNLMADLQENRRKYEREIAEAGPEVQVNELVEERIDSADIPDGKETPEHIDDNADGTPAEEKSRDDHLSLHQKPTQSLSDYYGAAKRVLFKRGGYDVGLSGGNTPAVLPAEKLRTLNQVSLAFIKGLVDGDLKHALLYINGSAFESPEPFPVSLSGVYCQAEIERLAKAWPERPIQEVTEKQEETSFRTVMEWNQLAWQAPDNPSLQNKHLYQLLDRMKRINSLQFAALEQHSHENAQAYYQRMNRVLEGSENIPNLLPVVSKQYINGVSDPQIQSRLRFLIEGPGNKRLGVKALVFLHNMLQVANEYERALSLGIYDDEHRGTIEAYISILRASSDLNWEETEKYLQDLSQSAEAAEIIAQCRLLPNPTAQGKPRDRYADHLSFPNDDSVGIQCDINFSADLALHNTHLLRCYAAADPRVRPMVLFVKSWACRRGINTPYRGTLSSYGYVLMVLHYLVNVATPFVLPNLQLLRRPQPPNLSTEEWLSWDTCKGLDVGFWRDEQEIRDLAQKNQLNKNRDSLGKLLRGFFEYFANNGGGFRGFDWGREVLSLRTQGGILTKTEKGWVGAKTTTETITTAHANPSSAPKDGPEATPASASVPKKNEVVKEVRHRYLFAIEDPFEVDHNVARTVNHDGIVAIREELRRAWRIIKDNSGPNSNTKLNFLADTRGAEMASNAVDDPYKKLMDALLEGGLRGYLARGGTPAGYDMYKGVDDGKQGVMRDEASQVAATSSKASEKRKPSFPKLDADEFLRYMDRNSPAPGNSDFRP